MRLSNLFNKKTPFEVLGINENAPDRYKLLFDHMNSYDERFSIDVYPMAIGYDDEYIEDRLLDKVSSIQEQIIDVYEKDKKNIAFAYFKDTMKQIGAANVTVEDWVETAAVAFDNEVKENPFSVPSYALMASYIGYIDLKDNDRFMGIYDDLNTVKEKYKEIMEEISKQDENKEVADENKEAEEKADEATKEASEETASEEAEEIDMTNARNFFNVEMENLHSEEKEAAEKEEADLER